MLSTITLAVRYPKSKAVTFDGLEKLYKKYLKKYNGDAVFLLTQEQFNELDLLYSPTKEQLKENSYLRLEYKGICAITWATIEDMLMRTKKGAMHFVLL